MREARHGRDAALVHPRIRMGETSTALGRSAVGRHVRTRPSLDRPARAQGLFAKLERTKTSGLDKKVTVLQMNDTKVLSV